jgi:hypothetical protein
MKGQFEPAGLGKLIEKQFIEKHGLKCISNNFPTPAGSNCPNCPNCPSRQFEPAVVRKLFAKHYTLPYLTEHFEIKSRNLSLSFK